MRELEQKPKPMKLGGEERSIWLDKSKSFLRNKKKVMANFLASAFLLSVSACKDIGYCTNQLGCEDGDIFIEESTGREIEEILTIFRNANVNFEVFIEGRSGARAQIFQGKIYLSREVIEGSNELLTISMFHEGFHMLMSQLLETDSRGNRLRRGTGVLRYLGNSYSNLSGVARNRIRNDNDPSTVLHGRSRAAIQSREEGLFRIFDESNYLCSTEEWECVRHGHPYSNERELFASSLTVMRFFPDRFIAQFEDFMNSNSYTEGEKHAVAEAARSVLHALEQATNNDEDTIIELLPRINDIRALLTQA